MKLKFELCARLAFAFCALTLASCSLPPEAAWHVVRTDGLIPLIAMEMGKKPYPANIAAYSHRPAQNQFMNTATGPVDTPAPVVVAPQEQPKPVVVVAPKQERYEGGDEHKTEVQPKRQLPKPNLITKKKSSNDDQPPVRKSTEVEHSPAVIATVKPRQESEATPKKAPAPAPSVASVPVRSQSSEPAKQSAPSTQAPVRTAEDNLPYGVVIPGRPGLVNSPYANKNQFVDVAGLKPGQEVKCPYTGKLFRVPVGAQASGNTKPAQAPDKGDDKKQ